MDIWIQNKRKIKKNNKYALKFEGDGNGYKYYSLVCLEVSVI